VNGKAKALLRQVNGVHAGPPLSGRASAAVVMLAMAATLVIAVIDYVTGVRLSLSVFYIIPVAATAVALSARAAIWTSLWAAAAWSVADSEIETARSTVLLQLWNGGLRFCVLAIVVALIAALRRAVDDARASDRRSQEFLAYAAHQLRTPVAGIRASAEALVLTASPTQREQLAANLTTEADRAGRLLHALLRLARLDQGEPPSHRPCDVEALLTDELDRLQMRAPGLELHLEVEPGVPASVMLDPTAVVEIMANLLDNARRHAAERVDVTVGRTRAGLRLAVGDDGAGLPMGAEERAFDRFVSLDGHGGSGLGLAIARSLAEAHGGGLTYTSGRFVVDLALQPEGGDPKRGSRRHGALLDDSDHRIPSSVRRERPRQRR